MAREQMTLGEFLKYLATLLSNKNTPMSFKDEEPWHLLLYRLQSEQAAQKPAFLERLVFDWGGPFPKCKDVSRYLQLLHVTGCVDVSNPSYKKMELSDGLQKLWYSQVRELPKAQLKYVQHAATLAKEEFSLAK
jgi:hypothetical protein